MSLDSFGFGYKFRGRPRNAFLLSAFLLFSLLALSAQAGKPSKVPDGEAYFTAEELKDYYLVYKNPDVRYLRTLFDSYLAGTGGSVQERERLDQWDKKYFRSKFIVLSRDRNTFGGTWITMLFQDRPDKVFVAWVYPEGSNKNLTLRELIKGDFSDEDIQRINVRYKKLLEDRVHAM